MTTPSARQQDQYAPVARHPRRRAESDARRARRRGDLAARGDRRERWPQKPWLPHFYLGHGIGTNAAEMPMIGTDLGEEFDDNLVFPAGMVLVLEPVVWEDGTRRLSKRGDRGYHRRRLRAVDRLPLRPLWRLRSVPDEPAHSRAAGASARWRQMEAHDLDVLVLGREANVRYVSGAPQLWVAGHPAVRPDLHRGPVDG